MTLLSPRFCGKVIAEPNRIDKYRLKEVMSIYLAVVGFFVGEWILQKGVVKLLCRYFGFFRKEGFWRRGFAGQFVMAFFSLAMIGLLGFENECGLTLRNVGESLLLLLLLAPFAVFYSLGAYLFIKKNKGAISMGWMKKPSDRSGTIIYCFTMNGIGEELFFRGLLQGALSTGLTILIPLGSFNLMYSTIIVSVIFTLVHFENVINKDETKGEFLLNLPYRTTIAFILGITFQITRSLLAPIVIHNISNGFSIIAAMQATKKYRKVK